MNREDLVFATCSQLSGCIREDWDDVSIDKEVSSALNLLDKVEEPDTNIDNKSVQCIMIQVSTAALKSVLSRADAWKSEEADTIKKELILRIRQYERRITQLSSPLLDLGPFELQT